MMDQNKVDEINSLIARNQADEEDVMESAPTSAARSSAEGDADDLQSEAKDASIAGAEGTEEAVAPEETASSLKSKPPVQAGESALGTYRKNARKFALLGGLGCVLGLVILITLQQQNNPLMILAAIVMLGGALFMVTGISALRPDGMVRAFAQVAAVQPTTAQMQDLLASMKNISFTGLRTPVKQQILSAVARYRAYEGYDEELADKIEEIAKNTRKRSVI